MSELDIQVFKVLMVGYVVAGGIMAFLHFAYHAKRTQHVLISDDPHRSVEQKKLWRDVVLNISVSVTLITVCAFGLQPWLFIEGDAPWWVLVIESIVVVFIYDFAYYFAHRYLMHEWKIMRDVHAVHHAARNPRTIDSLLLHPAETILGLGLMFGSLAAVGGVHMVTFGVLFIAYTGLNVLNHAGVNIQRFPFKTLGVLAVKHDRHHHSMLSGNYASITPLPDMVFGTVA